MYRIINIDGTELGVTDSVNYIKISENGCFTNTTAENAVGIAFNSVAYNLVGHNEIEETDTVVVSKIDGGYEIKSHQNAIDGLIQSVLEG